MSRTIDIRDYNVSGDGNTLNTIQIQCAINDCADSGGGRVLITGGSYLTGTLVMKSNVELHITSDSELCGSGNCNDYPEQTNLKHIKSELLPRCRSACLIFAEECENISITGGGKIRCSGESFTRERKDISDGGWKYERIDAPTPPRVVFFTGCKNVAVKDITMTDQPSGWSYWIHDCDHVTFDHCNIDADVQYPNNDGIHINSSRNVSISNCFISCGDDCIIVRANNSSLAENKVCERVTVTNCNLTSYASGIRIGWINDGIIRNCVFSNIVMTDTVTGINIVLPGRGDKRLSDEGREDTLIENLSFNNIVMDRTYAYPIRIRVSDNPVVRCAAIRHIYFSNIHARGLQTICLEGRPSCRLNDISFSDCTFDKVGDDVLPNYKEHGAAAWERDAPEGMFYADNVRFSNTSFNI
ncbi:MAG: hypothetical protein HFE63_08155 [Clostridiales bacterium]|nr:hypothetical protein [Clostridiales bacterium]